MILNMTNERESLSQKSWYPMLKLVKEQSTIVHMCRPYIKIKTRWCTYFNRKKGFKLLTYKQVKYVIALEKTFYQDHWTLYTTTNTWT